MKKVATNLMVFALSIILLGGCVRLGKSNDFDSTKTSQVISELVTSLEALPKAQSSQTEPTDTDLLIP